MGPRFDSVHVPSGVNCNGYSKGLVLAKTATYSIIGNEATDFVCDGTGGAFAITLPPVAGAIGLRLRIYKKDSSGNAITVTSASTELIIVTGSAATTFALSARGNAVELVSDGTNWYGLKS